jgi:hypothetical protein
VTLFQEGVLFSTVIGTLYERKTPLHPKVPSELGQNEICLFVANGIYLGEVMGTRKLVTKPPPEVAAYLALPPIG